MSSSTSSSRVFRRYLWTVFLSVFIVAIVFCAASECLIRTYVAPNQNIEAHAQFLRTAKHPNAAFGDSHVAMGVTGSEDIVSLGFPADTLSHVIGKAYIYYSRIDPGKVVLQADLQQLTPGRLLQRFESEEFLYVGNPLLFRALKLSIPIYRANIIAHWRAFFSGSPFELIRHFNPEDGSQTADTTIEDWDEERIREHARIVLYDSSALRIDKRHPVLVQYEELADWLIKKGATVCFVAYPVDRRFYEAARKLETEKTAVVLFSAMAARVGARYVNYTRQPFPPSDFFDPDHLNRRGGKAFTKRMMRDCFS